MVPSYPWEPWWFRGVPFCRVAHFLVRPGLGLSGKQGAHIRTGIITWSGDIEAPKIGVWVARSVSITSCAARTAWLKPSLFKPPFKTRDVLGCCRVSGKSPSSPRKRPEGNPARGYMSRLEVRFPALFVLALPHFHCFGVALDVAAFGVELQLAVYFPRNVRELEHGNGNVAL